MLQAVRVNAAVCPAVPVCDRRPQSMAGRRGTRQQPVYPGSVAAIAGPGQRLVSFSSVIIPVCGSAATLAPNPSRWASGDSRVCLASGSTNRGHLAGRDGRPRPAPPGQGEQVRKALSQVIKR